MMSMHSWLLFLFRDDDLNGDVFSLSLYSKWLYLYMSIDFFVRWKSMLYEIKCACLCICREWMLWKFIYDMHVFMELFENYEYEWNSEITWML
jgi:hypothetical protein